MESLGVQGFKFMAHEKALINPLHPNISIYILHTALCTFLNMLTRRICLKSRASLLGDHFLYSRGLNE